VYVTKIKGFAVVAAHQEHTIYCALLVTQNGMTFNADLAATAFLQKQPLIDYILTTLHMGHAGAISAGFTDDQARTVEKALKLKGMHAAITACVHSTV
jgi:hypothetical protein